MDINNYKDVIIGACPVYLKFVTSIHLLLFCAFHLAIWSLTTVYYVPFPFPALCLWSPACACLALSSSAQAWNQTPSDVTARCDVLLFRFLFWVYFRFRILLRSLFFLWPFFLADLFFFLPPFFFFYSFLCCLMCRFLEIDLNMGESQWNRFSRLLFLSNNLQRSF